MDILTQGLLGGVLAQSVAKKEETKLATLIGVISGLLADADIFIYSANDPLLNIELHRHFTHSLFFIPFGAAIAMALLWPFLKNHLPAGRIYLYSLLGYSMSGLLDACTSYGTHLLWPFSNERIAFNVISIIDPVFTISLLITLLYSLRVKRQRIAHIGLLLAAGYMLLGFVQLQRATNLTENLISSRGHQATQTMVKPTLGNLVLWRSVYVHQDRIYVDAIRVGLFAKNKIFEGESVDKLSVEKHFPDIEQTSVLYNDIQRFTIFSDNFVAIDPTQKNVIGDIRYSMLPTTTTPLWGIVINRDKPQEHADYQFFRDTRSYIREKFFDMLMWND
ncbi:MAG: metal-dependent hydrolase [Gammaproteobacteria bacterium]|nr:metal-dependent hydrolase [Gammaproteobacteria bacterium]